jgi:hypothetical protein
MDLLDGALRATGRVTASGGCTTPVDRVSEAAILFGILYYYVDRDAGQESLLAFAAIVGSLLVSYVKARGEVLGITIREGMFTRAERVILIGGGSIIDQVRIALWILARLANLAALQRLSRLAQDRENAKGESVMPQGQVPARKFAPDWRGVRITSSPRRSRRSSCPAASPASTASPRARCWRKWPH